MKFSSLILLVAATLSLAVTFAFDAETEGAIDNLVENVFMRNHRIPGVGLSVVRNGTVLMSKGYGMKNIAAGLSADENTLFAIGSITKTFVAVIVVKTLNELYPQRGAAVLDIPLEQLIPSTVNFTLSDRYRAEHTTFRDLLAHRTCLLNGGIELDFGSLPSEAEYVYRSRYLPQVCEFRNGFEYNNNMLSLAGATIAAIAGTTLVNMIISLLRDIGMTNTTYVDLDGSYESLPDMSQPYVLKDGRLVESDIFQVRKVHMALGAGGILSTPNDMAKYMDFHLNQGRIGDRQIVPRVMSWLYILSNPLDFRGGRTEDVDSIVYGELGTAQGFFSALYDGWSVIHHGGYWAPYRCEMRLFPATRIGVFICTNGPGFIINFPTHEILAYSIFDLVRGTNQSLEQILSNKVDVGEPTFIEHQLINYHKTNRASTALYHNQIRNRIEREDVLGVYGHAHNGDISIRYKPETNNTTLQLYFSEWAYGRLEQISGTNTMFRVEWETSIMDHFYSYPWGVPRFRVDFEVADTVLLRVDEWDLQDVLFEFVKNATLDTFPPIPWSPNSCGPE